MSGWEQQMFCEQRRWHEEHERLLRKMERDVERGKILQAELLAARREAQHSNVTQQVTNEILANESPF